MAPADSFTLEEQIILHTWRVSYLLHDLPVFVYQVDTDLYVQSTEEWSYKSAEGSASVWDLYNQLLDRTQVDFSPVWGKDEYRAPITEILRATAWHKDVPARIRKLHYIAVCKECGVETLKYRRYEGQSEVVVTGSEGIRQLPGQFRIPMSKTQMWQRPNGRGFLEALSMPVRLVDFTDGVKE